ncbi:MAG: Cyanophycin synthetase [Myxococcota bacterium]|nr:Cyanophycin synthetase [Myxococcota bacterium]
MKILETQVYRGPNLYGYRPVIRLTIDLEELEEYPSDKLEGFVDRLVAAIPTLDDHTCSYGVKGGFVRRLREGTWFGHILEHVALELQCLAGTPVTYGKCRGAGQPGVYHVIYSYEEERAGLEAGRIAYDFLRGLLPPHLPSASGENYDLEAAKNRLARIVDEVALGPSTRSLVEEARRRGIPAIRLNDRSLVQLGYGVHQKRIQATVTSETRHIAVEIAQDKELTLKLLRDTGIPVPRSVLVSSEEDAARAAEEVGYPCVVKPYNLSHGRAVSLNLTTEAQVREAWKRVYELADHALVEQFLAGKDYRVLVIGGEIVAVSERTPGHVIGDGQRTIRQLLDAVNADPRRGVGHEKVLTRIELDEQAMRLLQQAGLTPDSVLPAGKTFFLRSTANLSTGGTAADCTAQIHPDNAEIARRAARIIGLDVAGIDMILEDIGRPARESGGAIVEVNAAPGFRMHTSPTRGKTRDVAAPVIDMLFPPGVRSRIPIVSITGTNGKTTTSRMVAHILKMTGKRVGLTTTDGIYIDGERIMKGDMTGPWSARVVLRDPTVEIAVLETARGGILREGLGFDLCDVGCVLNVTADHLGQRGVNTMEDLAYVKRLVLEVTRDDGVSVINADDPLVMGMRGEAAGKHLLFSMQPGNPVIRDHVANGGLAASLEEGLNGHMITLHRNEQSIPLLWTHLIPATMEGQAMFNVANALAAAAMAFALGVSLENIRQGLRTFDTTFFQAPGRCNVYDQLPFKVVVDYGHNPAAIRAMGQFAQNLRRTRLMGVIGAPGDRRDEDIRAVGAAAAEFFDRIIFKEDVDRRGRPVGETAKLLQEGALAAGFMKSSITIIEDERDAVNASLAMAQREDVLVIFADDIPGVWKQVIYFGKPSA